MIRNGRRFAFAASLLATFAAGATAHASPEDLFSYGTRSPAMGGIGAATAQGYEAAYQNPALLSMVSRRKLTLGIAGAAFTLHTDGDAARGMVQADAAKGVIIGAETPIPFGGFLRNRVGFGLAFYTPTALVVRGRILYPETPQYPLLPDRAQSVTLRVGLGLDIGYGLRLGVGFAALAEIAGQVTVATDATGRVGARVEDQLVATYAPTFGVSYTKRVTSKNTVALGLAFRGKLDARFSVLIDATRFSSLSLPRFNIAGLAQYDPAQLTLEGAWIRQERVLGISLTYKRWSRYPGQLAPTILCPPDEPDCGALSPPKADYSDTVVVRVGAEQRVLRSRVLALRLRAGAFLEPTPLSADLPSSAAFDRGSKTVVQVPTRYFDATRLGLTWGVGLTFAKFPLDFDLYGQYQALLPRELTFAAGGPNGATATSTASGHVLAFGLSTGVKF
ncbi:MAG: hypothetical protein HOO96_07020 [Polyangiaceae bacterium]|nr:hypothetical protein [Polyangiaceae bacterium]